MGKNAKITRLGCHVAQKRAKKRMKAPNEGRRALRKAMKDAKKHAAGEDGCVQNKSGEKKMD